MEDLKLREGGLEILRERLYTHVPNAPTSLSDVEVLKHFSLEYYNGELVSTVTPHVPFYHLHFVEKSAIWAPEPLRLLGDILEDGSQALFQDPAVGDGIFGFKVIARNLIEEIKVVPHYSHTLVSPTFKYYVYTIDKSASHADKKKAMAETPYVYSPKAHVLAHTDAIYKGIAEKAEGKLTIITPEVVQ